MTKIADAVVNMAQLDQIKSLWNCFGFEFRIEDHSKITGTHVRVYLYTPVTYSNSCGTYSGTTAPINGWDQSTANSDYGFDAFFKTAKQQLTEIRA